MAQQIDDFPQVWYEHWDVAVLDLLRRKAQVLKIEQTIVATGIVALVSKKFSKAIGKEFTSYQVAMRIKYLHKRYLEFRWFFATDGISYDAEKTMSPSGKHISTQSTSLGYF